LTQQQLQKTYQCLTCKADIKLAGNGDNSGWDKFNFDGTPHIHSHQRQQQKPHQQSQRQQQPDYYSKEIEALTSQVKELKETVNILVTQITMLRGELKKH
jgi:hypothetical protein